MIHGGFLVCRWILRHRWEMSLRNWIYWKCELCKLKVTHINVNVQAWSANSPMKSLIIAIYSSFTSERFFLMAEIFAIFFTLAKGIASHYEIIHLPLLGCLFLFLFKTCPIRDREKVQLRRAFVSEYKVENEEIVENADHNAKHGQWNIQMALGAFESDVMRQDHRRR